MRARRPINGKTGESPQGGLPSGEWAIAGGNANGYGN